MAYTEKAKKKTGLENLRPNKILGTELGEIVKKEATPLVRVKKNKEQQREFDNQPVKGRFNFLEVPGGTLVLSYRKYKKDPIRSYSLEDGKTYTIPRGVAKHLANTGSYPVHEFQTDETGRPIVRIGRKKRRYSFEALGFFDEIEDETSKLYTVEKI